MLSSLPFHNFALVNSNFRSSGICNLYILRSLRTQRTRFFGLFKRARTYRLYYRYCASIRAYFVRPSSLLTLYRASTSLIQRRVVLALHFLSISRNLHTMSQCNAKQHQSAPSLRCVNRATLNYVIYLRAQILSQHCRLLLVASSLVRKSNSSAVHSWPALFERNLTFPLQEWRAHTSACDIIDPKSSKMYVNVCITFLCTVFLFAVNAEVYYASQFNLCYQRSV